MDKRYAAGFVSKPVLTLEGTLVGIASNTLFSRDCKRLVGLECFDEETGEETACGLNGIFRAGEGAILLSSDPVPPRGEWRDSPVGLPLYSLDGESLGYVSDVLLDGAKTVAVVAGETEYPLDRVVAFGPRAVLLDTAEPRTPLPARRRRTRRSASADLSESDPRAATSSAATSSAAPQEADFAETAAGNAAEREDEEREAAPTAMPTDHAREAGKSADIGREAGKSAPISIKPEDEGRTEARERGAESEGNDAPPARDESGSGEEPPARASGETGEATPSGLPEPAVFVCGDRLLIGRKLKCDVVNQRGEIIAREGERITATTIALAKRYGKLYDLTVGSLSNLL